MKYWFQMVLDNLNLILSFILVCLKMEVCKVKQNWKQSLKKGKGFKELRFIRT